MPPQGQNSWVLSESDTTTEEKNSTTSNLTNAEKMEWKIVWRNVIGFMLLHVGAVYGAYIWLFRAKWLTSIIGFFFAFCTGIGVTAGAHRLWAHKSYKARLPLRIILVIFNTIAFQDSVLDWSRDHRMHHRYTETDADPHNAKRGFFFSHIGWLLVRKHPEIKAKGHTIDMSDLLADPILRFQKKYYLLLLPFAWIILPTLIPTLWGETRWNAFFVWGIFRYVCVLNFTWMVNSVAHMWGNKPYDHNVHAVENRLVKIVAFGEGFHNYHHTYPWDYKTAELGSYSMNATKWFIDKMAKIGWAYDLKTVPSDVIEQRVKRTGDGSHSVWGRNIPQANNTVTNAKSM